MKNPFSFIRSIKDLYRTSREPEDMHRLSHLWWSVLIIVSPIVIFSVIAYVGWITWSTVSHSGIESASVVGAGRENALIRDLQSIENAVGTRENLYNAPLPTIADPYKSNVKSIQ